MAIAINGNGTITGITAGGLPDASIVDADIAAVGSGKLTGTIADARLPTIPVAKGGTGLTAAGASGQVLTSDGTNWASSAAAGGGDTRNFIIDGDFTQWPEGTTVTNPATDTYGPALWKIRKENSSAGVDYIRSTDVPTYAQSGHSSKYSMKIDCTTTTANPSHSTHGANAIRFFTTGSDNRYILGKEMTLSFWIKATKTGTSCVYFQNGSYNRTYVVEFTINTTLTWEKKTVTFTMDTAAGGTWGLDEADRGLQVAFALNRGGSVYAGAAGNWAASASSLSSTTNQINHLDSTSNVVYISQVMLVLGASAPDAFLGESISLIRHQLDYYFQTTYDYNQGRYPGTANTQGMVGGLSDSYSANTAGWYNILRIEYRTMMRKVPALTYYDRAGSSGYVTLYTSNGGAPTNGKTTAIDSGGTTGFRSYTGATAGNYPIYGHEMHYFADARH